MIDIRKIIDLTGQTFGRLEDKYYGEYSYNKSMGIR